LFQRNDLCRYYPLPHFPSHCRPVTQLSAWPHIFYYLKSYLIRNVIRQLSTQVGTTFLKSSTIQEFKILLPPTKAEQEAISTYLSDIDALIEKLDKLIAKKRDIKQATMQQLLTGKTRLPGFSGEWSTKYLRDISFMKGRIGWQGLKQSEFTMNADEPYLITGMNFKDGKIRWDEVYHVSNERYEIANKVAHVVKTEKPAKIRAPFLLSLFNRDSPDLC
jgi:type I restriction enzyme, S subunit